MEVSVRMLTVALLVLEVALEMLLNPPLPSSPSVNRDDLGGPVGHNPIWNIFYWVAFN